MKDLPGMFLILFFGIHYLIDHLVVAKMFYFSLHKTQLRCNFQSGEFGLYQMKDSTKLIIF